MVDRSPSALPLSERSEAFLTAIDERVVIYDGAMGTGVQRRNLTCMGASPNGDINNRSGNRQDLRRRDSTGLGSLG